MEDFVVPWKVSGLLHWVSGFRQSVWGFEVRVCFTFTSWVIEELGVFLMAFYDISGPTRTRHGVWRVSVGFMVVWFALYLKHRDFWVLDWAWGVLDGRLPFKGLPWTLRWSSWTDREQDFRVLDRSGGLLKGVPWTLTCSSRILKGRLGCSQGFFYGCLISRFLTWQQMFSKDSCHRLLSVHYKFSRVLLVVREGNLLLFASI